MTLTIYKASAGSGKTYKLTEEYLKLVIADPEKYKRILAITFTNKATAEMKSRIISELYKLSSGKTSAHKSALLETYNWLDNEQLIQRAGEVLQNILYNYNHFSVSTIDSFFQKIIKNFSRELGIKFGYNVELDTQSVLSKAIDLMLEEVGKNEALSKWLEAFTQNRIEEGKSWELKSQIEKFGYELFKENFQQFNAHVQQKISNKEFLKEFQEEIDKIIRDFENSMSGFGKEALNIISQNQLQMEDFSYGHTGVAGYFDKLANKKAFEPKSRALNALNDPDKWYSKSKDAQTKSAILQAYEHGLNNLLDQAITYYEQQNSCYESSKAVKRYAHVLGIITDLSNKIAQIREEDNILLITDVNQMLNELIDQNDAPFVLEKTGSRYQHYLIDEFQDTSHYQWANLKPLVSNSIDSNEFSLVVGDVKQSIYRWRNGDWELLNTGIYQDINPALTKTEYLEHNYRSEDKLIKFNNTLFRSASDILQNYFNASAEEDMQNQIISQVYKQATQSFPKNKVEERGFVKIRFFESENRNSWKNEANDKLPEQIDELLEKGFDQKDITILVRRAKDGNDIAKLLFETNRYHVVSKDSLFLKNSRAVRLIITVLKYLLKPDDQINRKNMLLEYLLAENNISLSRIMLTDDFHSLLPEEFEDLLENKSPNDILGLTESISILFQLNTVAAEYAYLLAFQDAIREFQKANPSNLSLFLEWWEEKGREKAIQIPEDIDAIRIMTIHKSKGLDFNIVILPYCSWEIDHPPIHENVLWVHQDESPFNKIELLPVKYGSGLSKSIFKADYFNEKLHTYMDNLNLLYVAFTRARHGLIVYGKQPENEKLNSVSDLLYQACQQSTEASKQFVELDHFFNEETQCLEIGQIEKRTTEKNEYMDSVELTEFISNTTTTHISSGHDSESLFVNDEKRSSLNYGKFMHEVLSHINTAEDIDTEIQRLYFEGKLTTQELQELKEMLIEFTSSESVKNWFSNSWEVKNETPILSPDNELKIPDRVLISGKEAVVIDFKFGEEMKLHRKQISGYKDELNRMGFNTRAYLVYFRDQKILEV